jgi:cytosine deaminase
MLVLSRQRDQSVMIGQDMEVRVVDIRGDKVRLGFVAPREVGVFRKEVYEAILRENKAAASVVPEDLAGLRRSPQLRLVHPPPDVDSHQPFVRAAIEEARASQSEGGVPIGAVLVREGQIIARGCDLTVQRNDPTAHAEIVCLASARRQPLHDATLYCTLMPCFLCAGAAVEFRIPRFVIGDSVNYTGRARAGASCPGLLQSHGVELVDLADSECVEMMAKFVREHPDRWG